MTKDLQLKSESSLNSCQSFLAVNVPLHPVFVQAYENLLNDALHRNDEAVLLSTASVEKWCDMLRLEVLNWVVHLRQTSFEHVQGQCAAQKSAIDVETNEVMRHHRRRPATLQSDVYEGRLREIETKQVNKETCRARLKKRVAQFEKEWLVTQGEDRSDNREAKVLEQVEKIEKMAYEANSINALQTQERKLAGLISSFIEACTDHYNETISELSRQKKLLESECRSYLRGCGRSVPANLDAIQDLGNWGGDSDEDGCKEIVELLVRLRNAAVAVEEKVMAEREQHVRCMDAARANYFVVYEQNVGELQVLARIQEILSRLKVQVHSLTTLSDANEAKIEDVLKELEEKIATPASLYNFTNTLREITCHEHGASSYSKETCLQDGRDGSDFAAAEMPDKGSTDVMTTEDRARKAESVLNQRLAELTLDTQRQIKSSDLAKALRLLDNLREVLYTRGRYLNCLQYGVEFFNVPQEDYIEPRLCGASESTAEDVMGGSPVLSSSPQGRSGRRSRSLGTGGTVSLLYPTVELPVVLPAEREINDGIAAVKAQVSGAMEQHFAVCPPPLLRRLAGMAGGSLEDVMDMSGRVCGQQHQHVMEHVKQATVRYREQVQRVVDIMRKMPDYLTNTVHTTSATALEQRVATVFSVFSAFYGESDALRMANDRLLKVSLASNYNRDKLDALCDVESTRQVVTSAAVEKFWGFALREMQKEAAMHVAKTLNVNNTFFALVRGIVLPENLKPAGDEDGGGHHRGLRRLLRLKAKEDRAKELQEQQGLKRERRLQETMPRLTRGGGGAAGGKKLDSSSASGGVTSDLSGGLLPLPPSLEVEHGRVPLHAFRPLEEFNTTHPRAAVVLSNQETVPAFARLLATPCPSSQSTTRRSKKEVVSSTPAEDRVGTVSIVAPATLLSKEVATCTQQSVEHFNEGSMKIATKTNEVFQKWAGREVMWRTTWETFIQNLKA